MIDFLLISTRSAKKDVIEIYPKFIIKKSSDLMIKGGDFYAIWIEERGLWSTDEQDVLQLIDRELDRYAKENHQKFDSKIRVLHMWDSDSGMIDHWHKYCQRQLRDSFHMLDDKLVFSNTSIKKDDYASKKLNYPLERGDITAYDKLMSIIYTKEERQKIEWAIGSIVCGDSKKLQKFVVLYGGPGTGKSTILNIIQMMFNGYYSAFDAKALGSSNNSFALEAFKSNPLVAIQHDGDLSRIEDNTRLNSLVSHEYMTVNEKFKSEYVNQFKSFLFLGTNKPVKITDAKSGLIRRLIDVSPSGNKLTMSEYKTIMKQIEFELGAIAYHCQEVYLSDPGRYDDYIPISMLGASNDFYNFVIDSYHVFSQEDGTTLKAAWEMYKVYCDEAKITYPFSQRIFKEELKNYFKEYKERFNLDDGFRVRNYYIGFRTEKFEDQSAVNEPTPKKSTINFGDFKSIFDTECAGCLAQYTSSSDKPIKKWDEVKSTLSDIDTSKVHYVKVPDNHIVIDFDIPDEKGEKSYERNIQAASLFPPTYAEVSKGGSGVHLHYIFNGDVNTLSSVYDDHIEVKKFNVGHSALRRKLSKCNDLPIATISSGLPLKEENKVINFETVLNEKAIRTLIKKNLNKEYHPGTASSVSFINKILEDAYNKDTKYDVTDMRSAILAFAAQSTNQSDTSIKLVNKMKFKSDEPSTPNFPINVMDVRNTDLVFYDVEVFPNLFIVNWKVAGEGKLVIRMINPTPTDIEGLLKFNLVGFNCRRYDNHIFYARLMGYTNEQLYNLSQKIINGEPGCFFGEAYNISYTDIYDFLSAGNKMSLKKWEIKLGIHHQELGLPWDQPVPEEKWVLVAEYCDNDVIATEAVFNYNSADWTARQILAELAGMTFNDTTNTLTTRIIFGKERKPQGKFNWRDMAEPVIKLDDDVLAFLKETKPEMMSQLHYGWQYEKEGEVPFGFGSILPFFPGYKFENGKSTYRGFEVGEGGFVFSNPWMYGDVALLDVVSMHPTSTICEVLFGVEFTTRYKEIVEGRVNIKHEAWDVVNTILDGKLTPYIQKVLNGEMTSDDLANALKTAINSVYGLTMAGFENPFRDLRNKDNIVAKRGALFMIDLKHEVESKGFTVAHIKTDSIKIPDATPEIIQHVMNFGLKYGYEFEHEATYDKLCLVNDAVYIAKHATEEKCKRLYGYIPKKNKKNPGKWTATGTQFAVPYVFKKLFSGEEIAFDDLCETKSVTSALYLDMNEELPTNGDICEKVKILREKIGGRYSSDILNETEYNKLSGSDRNTWNAWQHASDEELDQRISKGHKYHFVGKVGQFCPIKEGCGGGILLREKDGKYYAATGSKGYRWLESETIKDLGKESIIDRSYYDHMVEEASKSIWKYGDVEWFTSDKEYDQYDNGIHPF